MIKGKRLFQQYIIDALSCVKEKRFDYIKRNQKHLWSEIYQDIKDAIVRNDVDGDAIGKKIILPSNIFESPRYMI